MIARWPDYVLRGAAVIFLLFVLVQVFGAGDAPTTISPTPVAHEADPAERDLLASVSNPNAVWEKVAFVLRRLGHLDGNATATEADIRAGLKRYQHTVALRENGILSREVLNRILDERMVLTPYIPREAQAHGRWFLTQAGADCSVSTGAVSVEGRVLATRVPALRMAATQSTSDGALEFSFAREDLFDTSKSLIVSGITLKPNGTLSGGAARDLISSLRSQKDDVLIEGASVFGGPLRLRFSTLGFGDVFAALGEKCGGPF